MSDLEKARRVNSDQWRPKGRERFRRPIDVYFQKHAGLTVEELEKVNPRLLEIITRNNQRHLIAGQPPVGHEELGVEYEKYQALASEYEIAFTAPSGIRKRVFRPRRFGVELLRWLLETYPKGLPSPEKMRQGDADERKFYNDLKYAHLLGHLNKFKGLNGEDPVELYYALCKSEGRIITRGELPYLQSKGGKAIHRALGRLRDPNNPAISLLQKHVPLKADKVPAALKKLFED